jgi:hypothetical protein
MESLRFSTGLHTILTGIWVDADRASAIAVERSSTSFSAPARRGTDFRPQTKRRGSLSQSFNPSRAASRGTRPRSDTISHLGIAKRLQAVQGSTSPQESAQDAKP